MNPPWLQFPNIPFRSIGWKMGHGETYMNGWVRHFFDLSPEEKSSYIKTHPAPDDWPGWYQAIEQIERTRREDEEWFKRNGQS